VSEPYRTGEVRLYILREGLADIVGHVGRNNNASSILRYTSTDRDTYSFDLLDAQ
jgi:hypothetical protein